MKRTQEKPEGRNEQQAEVEDDITEITSADIEMVLRNMKNGKAAGPDNLPVEVWKSLGLGRTGVNFLKEALNKITDETYDEKASRYQSTRIKETL